MNFKNICSFFFMLLFCDQINITAASDQNTIDDSFHDDSTNSMNDYYNQKIAKKIETSSDYHIHIIKYLENDPPNIKNINDNKALEILIKLCEKDDLKIRERI